METSKFFRCPWSLPTSFHNWFLGSHRIAVSLSSELSHYFLLNLISRRPLHDSDELRRRFGESESTWTVVRSRCKTECCGFWACEIPFPEQPNSLERRNREVIAVLRKP